MKQAVFVQLPPPRFSLQGGSTNIPLAAGFLVNALKAGKSREIEPHILPSDVMDLRGDLGLIEAIGDRNPSVVAMTLYVWNVNRSLFIASQIKKRLPGVSVLVGGPEVTPDNEWLQGHPAVDWGVFGEGESRISHVIQALVAARPLDDLPGIFRKTSAGRIRLNPFQAGPCDLSAVPYPYLNGTVRPSRDGVLFLETVRGCPFQCRYCYYHKAFRTVRVHPWESMQKALDFAYGSGSGVKEIYLMDPTFNTRPRFRDFLRSVIARRGGDFPVLHTELRADLLTGEDVNLLRDAGLASAEVGLQTTNRAALLAAGREGDLERTARGIALLKAAGVEVTTGIIVGLPEDTPAGFSSTVEWLKSTEAYSVVHPFILSVLPGTDFRQRANELGLSYDLRPPYHVRETPTFPASEIRNALLRCEDAFDMELDHIPLPSLVDRGESLVTDVHGVEPITKWIVNPLAEAWKRLLPRVLPRVSDPFTFWLKGPGGSRAEKAALGILDAFSRANPHTVIAVVVELGELPSSGFFQRIVDTMGQPAIYANSSLRPLLGEGEVATPILVLVAIDPGSSRARNRLKNLYEPSPAIVWNAGLPSEERVAQMEPPILISTPQMIESGGMGWLLKLLKTIHQERSEEILFRDPDMQREWSSLTGTYNASAPKERILRTP